MPGTDWGSLQWFGGERYRKMTEVGKITGASSVRHRTEEPLVEVSDLADREKLLSATETQKSGSSSQKAREVLSSGREEKTVRPLSDNVLKKVVVLELSEGEDCRRHRIHPEGILDKCVTLN